MGTFGTLRLGFGLGSRSAPIFVGPFDNLYGQLYCAPAFSRLFSAYTGPGIVARRSSDNDEEEIGFTPSGDLDTATLLAFAGAGSAYVVTWYDQTGNGRHATQATGAAQPRLVNAGVLDVGPNGRPVAVFSGAQYLDVQNSVGFSRNKAALTYAAVCSRTSGSSGAQVLSVAATSGPSQLRASVYYNNATTFGAQARSTDISAVATAAGGASVALGEWARLIGRPRFADGIIDLSVNGTVTTSGAMTPAQNTPDADSAANVRIGAFVGGTFFLTGNISTVVLAESAFDIAALDAALEEVMP